MDFWNYINIFDIQKVTEMYQETFHHRDLLIHSVTKKNWMHSTSHSRSAKEHGRCQGEAGSWQEWLADDSGSSRRLSGKRLFRAERRHLEEALYLSKSLWELGSKEDVVVGCQMSPAGTHSEHLWASCCLRRSCSFQKEHTTRGQTFKFIVWLCFLSSSLTWAGKLMPLP